MATDDAILFLWTTAPLIFDVVPSVLQAWGNFRYRAQMIWDKEHMGLGHFVRVQHEHLIIATRGNFPTPPESERRRSVHREAAGEHSTKPTAFYNMIEKMYPTLAKIELFARARRLGWISIGDQLPAA